MNIAFCGGAREVGASCIFVKIDGRNIVLDCGMRMNASKDQLPDLRMIQENGGVDAIFLTHAHMDHSGSLPVISREYPNARIYMTHVTKDLIKVLLYDSLKIMEFRESEIPTFAEVHVKNMLDRILCFSPGYTFRPFGSDLNDLTVTFYNAGHVAGSAGIYVSGQEGSLFYSGDFSITPQRTVEGASIPRLRPDIAIFESTYGDRLHAGRENEESRLVSKVKEVIQSGHKVLIPAFALGRAQEVILILKKAINRGELPAFKIYIDGMVKDICRIYNLNPNYLRSQLAKKAFKSDELFYDDNVIAVTGKQPQREAIINSIDPCCIISSSGMLTGGPSQWYAEKLASDEGSFIAVTGYQDEEAPGRQLLDIMDTPEGKDRILKFGERSIPLKSGIGKYGLSAHADKTEIISLVHALGARDVFFVHGDNEVISSLASEVQKEYRGRIHAPGNGDELDMEVRKPRKQLEKTALATQNNSEKISENVLKEVWELVLKNYGTDRAFTLEEILFIWNGKKLQDEDELKDLANLIHTFGYFQGEARRPFIYHAMSMEEFSDLEKTKSGAMEVNAMLALAENWFPPEAGLYKKGAKIEEKIVLLNFNFPQVAVEKYEEKIENFERETGWKAQVNNDCNLSAVQNLVTQLLSSYTINVSGTNNNNTGHTFNITIAGGISYFRNENLVKLNVSGSIIDNEKKRIEKEFEEKAGIKLELVSPGKHQEAKKAPVKKLDYQMEQNQALSLIGDVFADKEDKLYKKSLKQIDGDPCIELSFISPTIGNKYQGIIDELESRTRWSIKVNPTPNQNEILNFGIRLLQEHGVLLKKNLAYLPKEMQVRAVVNDCDDSVLDKVKELFERKTGIKLTIQ